MAPPPLWVFLKDCGLSGGLVRVFDISLSQVEVSVVGEESAKHGFPYIQCPASCGNLAPYHSAGL